VRDDRAVSLVAGGDVGARVLHRTGGAFQKVKVASERLGLDTSHFKGQGWNEGAGNGRDPEKQRSAKRRYYDANPDVYSAKRVKRQRELASLIHAAKDRPCADCGGKFPHYVMDFDHRDGEEKLFNVGRGRMGKARVIAEMAKCDVICANCHRIRTAIRSGWAVVA
jgi:hypothetical protein